ncbi:DNA-3-methyladenine glycosylase [Arthrobacter sp. AOP36-A1-22]|uniref:DNA-3-methyladenine glycosylase n=1 Tax=unclassified Arthrobacter TaxID=235627 RepID=UPI002651321F|nr:DNA-3-methyladenine glycosylase [Micrococcaceae bacterium]
MSGTDPQLTRTAIEVAPLLLGCVLTVEREGHQVGVRITEVEAYEGAEDPGSHAYRGRTARNDSLFGPPGTLYCYFTYGMHHCANVVCGTEGRASAVLLRGGEIIGGADTARARRRNPRRERDLANGPAKLAQAVGLDLSCNGLELITGVDVTDAPQRAAKETALAATLSRLPATAPPGVRSGPRVGVAGPGGSNAYHWRFWLEEEPTVSAYRAAKPRHGRKPAGTPGHGD